MTETRDWIPLRSSGAEVGEQHAEKASFDVEPFELYGRRHEVSRAEALVTVTRVTEGLHLDLDVDSTVRTTCDRTLQSVELRLRFGDSELVTGPQSEELSVEEWHLNLPDYTRRTLRNEIPMQVFAEGTEPLGSERDEDEIDPRWRGLNGLFAPES